MTTERESPDREQEVGFGDRDVEAAETGGARDDRERIARRAYERFQERGGEHGHDQEDWYEAERELRGANKA
jgi:hypothetical protein